MDPRPHGWGAGRWADKHSRLRQGPDQLRALNNQIIEPIARSVTPWWAEWCETIGGGARVDEWRFRADLPAIVEKLDRAAGLNHRELSARSLWID